MSRVSRSRPFGWTLVGALAVAATLMGGAVAPAAAGAIPLARVADGGTPDQKRVPQIRAEIESYLKSLKRERRVKGAFEEPLGAS